MLESYLHFLYSLINTMPSEATSSPRPLTSPLPTNLGHYTTLQIQSALSTTVQDFADAEANIAVPRCELCKQRKVCTIYLSLGLCLGHADLNHLSGQV